jgi:hypothetical protein
MVLLMEQFHSFNVQSPEYYCNVAVEEAADV